MRLIPSNKKSYPINPGVYRMLNNEDKIIYIGKAKNLKNRLASYFDSSIKSARIKLMIAEIKEIEITITATENDALVLEQKLITKIKPKYNIIFRDDKSYPFIALSKHKFPKLYISREKSTKIKKENLFGPYPKSEDAYKNVEYAQKIFKLRTCSDNEFAHRSRPCMLYSIGKCSAPCVNKNDTKFQEEYNESVNQSKKLLNGQISLTIIALKEKMKFFSDNYEYEQAAKTRDMINAIHDLSKKQTVFSIKEDNVLVFNYLHTDKLYIGYSRILDGVPQEVFHLEIKGETKDYGIDEILTKYIETESIKYEDIKIISPIELKECFYNYQYNKLSKQYGHWLNLVKDNLQILMEEEIRLEKQHSMLSRELNNIFIPKINSLDCIDISHFNGEATYGGKIRWTIDAVNNVGNLDKEYYRLSQFNGNTIDDIYYMNKTVERIYHSDNDFPTVLIIDGDIPQLDAAFKALKDKELQKDYILMSSAKGTSRKKGLEVFHIHPNSIHLIHPQYINGNVLKLDKDNQIRLLIQYLQDTAHNFSNSARKKKMSKDRFNKK